MNFRLATPAVLVDLNDVPQLAYISGATGGLRLGGMTRQRAVERSELVARDAPLLSHAIRFVAHPAIRSRGTIGGSLAHADPAAELPAVMIALGATVTARSRERSRAIAAIDFFTGLFSTALARDELLTEIAIPPPAARTAYGFDEISRRSGDFALAGVAAAVTLDDHGRCAAARVGLLGLGDRPLLAASAARLLIGQPPSPDIILAAAEASAAEDIDPSSDIHASSRYRRRLAAVLIRRVLERAFHTLSVTTP
jgi:CO/xanthine dehydrogenase FAD-binding subunit